MQARSGRIDAEHADHQVSVPRRDGEEREQSVQAEREDHHMEPRVETMWTVPVRWDCLASQDRACCGVEAKRARLCSQLPAELRCAKARKESRQRIPSLAQAGPCWTTSIRSPLVGRRVPCYSASLNA